MNNCQHYYREMPGRDGRAIWQMQCCKCGNILYRQVFSIYGNDPISKLLIDKSKLIKLARQYDVSSYLPYGDS